MSPESILLSAAPAAPSAPRPTRSAAAAASQSGADCALGTGTHQPQSTPSPAPAGQSGRPGAQPAPSRSATAGPAGRKDTGEQQPAAQHKPGTGRKPAAGHKPGASKSAHGQGHPTQPARAAHSDGSFSQALAQSLATPGRGGGSPSDKVRGHGSSAAKSTDKPAAHAPAKESKSDPVVSALALVSQAPPGAPPAGATGAGSGKGQDTVVSASLSGKPKEDGHGAKAALAHATAQDLKALGPAEGAAAASPATAPANSAAALTGAQAAVAAGTAAPAHAAATIHSAGNPAATLSAPVGTNAWTDQLGARLTWMTHQGIQSASLQLSPEHLGPLQVSISVHHGQASVWFGAAHAETRQALEQAMPQLRQMFSGQGLTLADSGVSRESPRDQAPRKGSVGQIGAIAEDSGAGTSGSVAAHLGLVDAYA